MFRSLFLLLGDEMLRLFFLLILAGCGGTESRDAKPPTPVRAQTVESRTDAAGTRYSGTIQPARRVDVAFRVGGYVGSIGMVTTESGERRALEPGDFVTRGTELAQLRTSDYLQRLQLARAAVAEATAGRTLATTELERARTLAPSQAIAQSTVDTASARAEAAGAQLDAASARAREAEIMLADSTVRAPMDGIVLMRRVEVGSLAGPGTLAFVIADVSTVRVVFGAPDTLVERLREGSELTVTLEALPGERTATVTRIAPAADERGRVFSVEASMPNPNGELRVGMIAGIQIPGAALAQQGAVLPLTSIVRNPDDPRGFAVFVLDGDQQQTRAHLRVVELGDVLGNMVLVENGLRAGERVVSMGATLIRDGDAVRVVR